MSADTTLNSYGISVVDGSKFTFLSGGTYNLAFSAQLGKVSGSGAYTISIWARLNGTDIDDSTGDMVIEGIPSAAPKIAAWTYLITVNPGDYVELVWSSDNVNSKLYAIPTRVDPIRPACPSVIVAINEL